MAWEGAFGLVPPEADGAVMSGAFVAYEVDQASIDPQFLRYYFQLEANWGRVGKQSSGTNVRRQSLHPRDFESAEILLPPLSEQQRIVARIDEAATHIDHALRHQASVAAEADELCRAVLRDPATSAVPLRELVNQRPPDVSVQAEMSYRFAGVYSFGRGVFVGSEKAGTEFAYPRLTRLRTGDFVYPKLMAWEGAFGVVPPECDGLVVSTEFPVFEVDRERVLPDVLDVHFRNPSLWASIGGASTGTNVRRRRLNPQDFLNLEVPLPSMSRQQVLSQTCQHVREIKARQSESGAMLQALLPAILDRAFAGAL